jgi:outer membrane protein assembly factor BamA
MCSFRFQVFGLKLALAGCFGLILPPQGLFAQVQGQLSGFRIKPENILFVGNLSLSVADLRSIFQNAGNLMGTLKPSESNLYDSRRLNMGVNALLAFYRNRGYIKATISPPEFEYGSSSANDQVQVIFHIVEEHAYLLGEIKINEAQALVPAMILGLLNLTPKALVNVTKIDSGVAAVRSAYLNLGYLDAEVTSTLDVLPQKKVVDLSVNISEGKQFHVGRIQFVGTPAIQESLLREFLPMQKGDLFGEKTFHAALDALNSLGPPYPLTSSDVDFHIDRNQAVVDLTIYLGGKIKKGEAGKP